MLVNECPAQQNVTSLFRTTNIQHFPELAKSFNTFNTLIYKHIYNEINAPTLSRRRIY